MTQKITSYLKQCAVLFLWGFIASSLVVIVIKAALWSIS